MYVVPLVRPERCFNFFGEANFFSLKSLDFYILVKAYETKLIFGEAIEVNFLSLEQWFPISIHKLPVLKIMIYYDKSKTTQNKDFQMPNYPKRVIHYNWEPLI